MNWVPYIDYVRQLWSAYYSLSANNTEQKILNFADMRDGWNYGEGEPIDAAAILEACLLHSKLLTCGFYETDAFPGLSGEVQVTAYWKDDYFEFTREKEGEWSFIHERLDEIIEETYSLNTPQLESIVESLHERICNTSDFCQENIGTGVSIGLRASPLNRQVIAESPLLNRIASSPHHAQYVSTFAHFIQAPESHRYTGRLTTPSSQMTLELSPP